MAKNKINARVERVKLSELVFLDNNARYMESRQWNRLVENIKQDGVLTSAPLVCRAGKNPLTNIGKKNPDVLEVISGNHRAQAAIEAGIEFSDVIVIDEDIPRQKKIAMQLAHNEITGKDDASILQSLYDKLDFDFKQYSGIDEAKFELDDLDLKSLGTISAEMQEISILFIPQNAVLFVETLQKIEKKKNSNPFLVADYKDFDLFFDSVVSTKKHFNIHNTATAIAKMCEIVSDFINSLENEADDLPPIKEGGQIK